MNAVVAAAGHWKIARDRRDYRQDLVHLMALVLGRPRDPAGAEIAENAVVGVVVAAADNRSLRRSQT